MRLTSALTLLGVIAATLAACVPASAALAQVAGQAGAAEIDILHQSVEIAPFAGEHELSGRQTLTFVVKVAGDRLRFAGGPLDIRSMTLDGRPLTGWRVGDGGVEIDLGRTATAGSRHALGLIYQAAPGRGFNRSDALAYSGYFACDWMLCNQSDLADRFTADVAITAPAGMRTLGPGDRVSTEAAGEGLEVHRWRTREAFPAYVHAFAVGRLETVDVSGACAARLDVWTSAPADSVAPLFGETCAMLEYLEKRAGVPLPGGRYSQLYVPERFEAQEAISHSILGGSAVEAVLQDTTEDWAVPHELAHQWWGNRITARDLSQFWLNEGVVTFLVATWKERRWGPEAYAREIGLLRDRWTRCRNEWRDVPMTYAEPYPSLGMRRCFQYSKAAVFLHELRALMGEEAFWMGFRAYTAANMGRAVQSSDFQSAMQQATSIDLTPMFTGWVHGEGAGPGTGPLWGEQHQMSDARKPA